MWQIPAGIFLHDPPHQETGILEIEIGLSGGKSAVTKQYNTRALKIIRSHYLDDSGQAYVTIVNPGGGYVGGDAYRINVAVDDHASLLLTDQSAAKVYRTPGDFVVQNITMRVGDGAVLEYIPDQLILYRDADFRQHLTADVHPNGSLFMSDIVTPGWSPGGEQFRYRQALLRNVIKVDGQVEIIDNLRINPLEPDFQEHQRFYTDGRTHIATVICVDPKITEDHVRAIRQLIADHSGGDYRVLGSVSPTDRPGFIVRALSDRTEELLQLIMAIADYVRAETRGQRPIHTRKY